jgi:uncharacterized membrane protein YcaP (DUF421 family)
MLFGHGTTPLGEIVVRCAIVFLVLLVGLRLTGKRQSGHLTPYDLILLLLIANAVQNAMVGSDTSLVGGLVAMATLLGINALVAWFSRRNKRVARFIEGTPTLLIHHGEILETHCVREGISREDLLRALREHGVEDVQSVRTAILEVDGSISVLLKKEDPPVPRPHHQIRGIGKVGPVG